MALAIVGCLPSAEAADRRLMLTGISRFDECDPQRTAMAGVMLKRWQNLPETTASEGRISAHVRHTVEPAPVKIKAEGGCL